MNQLPYQEAKGKAWKVKLTNPGPLLDIQALFAWMEGCLERNSNVTYSIGKWSMEIVSILLCTFGYNSDFCKIFKNSTWSKPCCRIAKRSTVSQNVPCRAVVLKAILSHQLALHFQKAFESHLLTYEAYEAIILWFWGLVQSSKIKTLNWHVTNFASQDSEIDVSWVVWS